MSNTSERSEGLAEEVGGKLKKGVGKMIGDRQMEAEGAAKEAKGQAQQEAAKAAERGKGKFEEVVGAVKNRVGAVIGDRRLQAEGKAEELTGEARQQANKQAGRIGYALLWLLGVPLPILLIIYLLRGH